MRHARFSLEEQVGGLVDQEREERYELRRAAPTPAQGLPRRAEQPRRPLTIRASRVDGRQSHAA